MNLIRDGLKGLFEMPKGCLRTTWRLVKECTKVTEGLVGDQEGWGGLFENLLWSMEVQLTSKLAKSRTDTCQQFDDK